MTSFLNLPLSPVLFPPTIWLAVFDKNPACFLSLLAIIFPCWGETPCCCDILLANTIGSVPVIKSISEGFKLFKPVSPAVESFWITLLDSFSISFPYVSVLSKLSITELYSLASVKNSEASFISFILVSFCSWVSLLSFFILPIAFSFALWTFFIASADKSL